CGGQHVGRGRLVRRGTPARDRRGGRLGRTVTAPDGARTVGGERGAGTVLVLGLAAVVLLLVTAVAALGAAQQARSVARSAADLGALAGATALRWGHDPCTTAERVVRQNDGLAVACGVEDGGVVTVTAARAVVGSAGSWGGLGTAEVTARAGPRPSARLDAEPLGALGDEARPAEPRLVGAVADDRPGGLELREEVERPRDVGRGGGQDLV